MLMVPSGLRMALLLVSRFCRDRSMLRSSKVRFAISCIRRWYAGLSRDMPSTMSEPIEACTPVARREAVATVCQYILYRYGILLGSVTKTR